MKRTRLTKSLFSKLFLAYALVIISISMVLASIMAYHTGTIVRARTYDYNMRQLISIDRSFHLQLSNFTQMQRRLYTVQATSDQTIYDLIEDYYAQLDNPQRADLYVQAQEAIRSVYNYLTYVEQPASDGDVLLYLITTGEYSHTDIKLFTGNPLDDMPQFGAQLTALIAENVYTQNARRSVSILPATTIQTQTGPAQSTYVLYDDLRIPAAPSNSLGKLIVAYATSSLDAIFEDYSEPFLGNAYLLRADGTVLYSNRQEKWGTKFSDFESTAARCAQDAGTWMSWNAENGTLMSAIFHEDYGFYTVGELEPHLLTSVEDGYMQSAAISMLICCLAALTISYAIMRFTARRTHDLVNTMQIAQTGDLTVRAKTNDSEDELDILSNSLNRMIENLSAHIQSEYGNIIARQQAELRSREAELYALQSQINPHFLYNTLEVIRMKALTNGDRETSMLVMLLARLFRDRIKSGMALSIEGELSYCSSVVDIYNAHYNGELELDVDVPSELMHYGILKDLLNPILENALIHGVGGNADEEGFSILISGMRQNDDIILTVQDNGVGMTPEQLQSLRRRLKSGNLHEGGSVGLLNAHLRLQLAYGPDYGLYLNSTLGVGTSVTVRIKALTVEELNALVVQRFQS